MIRGKKGVSRKFISLFAILLVVLLLTGVLAKVKEGKPISKEEVEKYIEEKNPEINVQNVGEVDLENPPEQIDIEKIEDTEIAIYEVDYSAPNPETQQIEEKKVFVVSATGMQAAVPVSISINYLQFGSASEERASAWLETATGVMSSEEAGYVMMRQGSITGLSTNLEVVSADDEPIKVTVYKNGEDTGLTNYISATSEGVQIDYDLESTEIDEFQAGDVISVKVETNGNAVWKNVITMVEITY